MPCIDGPTRTTCTKCQSARQPPAFRPFSPSDLVTCPEAGNDQPDSMGSLTPLGEFVLYVSWLSGGLALTLSIQSNIH